MKEKIFKYGTVILCYSVNFILPILFFKEISHCLPSEILSSFFFVLALIIYCQYVVEYGINISLLKRFNENKDNLSPVISEVIWLKVFLFLLCTLFLSCFLYVRHDGGMFFILVLILIGNVFSCQFLYQVKDKLYIFYILNAVVKIIFIPVIYINNNPIYLLFCYSLFNVIPNLIAFLFFLYEHRVKLVFAPKKNIFLLANECFGYFLSSMSITFYTSFYQILLGVISPIYLAAYALSDKIIRGVVSGNYVIIQIIQVQYLNNESVFLNKIGKVISILFAIGLLEVIFIWAGSDLFSNYFFPDINTLPSFMKMMSLLIVIILVGNFFAMVYLPCSGNTSSLSKIIMIVSIVSIVVSPVLIYAYAGYGAVASAILSEALVLALCYRKYRKENA